VDDKTGEKSYRLTLKERSKTFLKYHISNHQEHPGKCIATC